LHPYSIPAIKNIRRANSEPRASFERLSALKASVFQGGSIHPGEAIELPQVHRAGVRARLVASADLLCAVFDKQRAASLPKLRQGEQG
jgi:hypothetical protein